MIVSKVRARAGTIIDSSDSFKSESKSRNNYRFVELTLVTQSMPTKAKTRIRTRVTVPIILTSFSRFEKSASTIPAQPGI